jgi:uncharacterized protein (DUF58 family)
MAKYFFHKPQANTAERMRFGFSHKKKRSMAFVPQTTGIFVLLIIVLAFIAGAVRRELALSLLGAVFLVVWLYCLAMTLLLALFQRGRAGRFSIRISPREIPKGDRTQVFYSDKGINFRLPGILIRYNILLSTGDGRHVRHTFDPSPSSSGKNDPAARQTEIFEAGERGAYFSNYDEFAVFDALGFFRFAFRVPQEAGPRLLVCPGPAPDPPSPAVHSGGTEQPAEFQLRRSDNLVDHRPYIPGDDPRRINWKLFSHGGELIVREGEPEPPPHSNIMILIDTHYDTLLYSADTGRRGVDLLCENALAAALDCTESGMDVLTGYTGSGGEAGYIAGGSGGANAGGGAGSAGILSASASSDIGTDDRGDAVNAVPDEACLRGNTPAELAAVFARPAAIPWPLRSKKNPLFQTNRRKAEPMVELPSPPDDRGILVFALPRASADTSALNRLLDRLSENKVRSIELIFLYEGGKDLSLDDAAETCEALYNRRPGVRARRIKTGE